MIGSFGSGGGYPLKRDEGGRRRPPLLILRLKGKANSLREPSSKGWERISARTLERSGDLIFNTLQIGVVCKTLRV